MRKIDSFFSSSIGQSLYHYTGIRGLMGIVDSRAVWASHIYYLNDTKEIVQACEVLDDLLRKRESTASERENEFTRQFRDWLESFRRTPFHIFIFSLSEKASLLSQWRSYTPHGKGVSIGFSPGVLNHVLGRPGFRIARCLYQPAEHIELMESLLEKMFITFRQRGSRVDATNAHPSQKYHPFLEEFRKDILQVLAIIKHPAFREECEWRIVSPYFPKYTVEDVKFREGASMLMPYTELKLPAAGALFEEVILGPSQDINLSFAALSSYLSNRRACNRTVNSQIPLRKWDAN